MNYSGNLYISNDKNHIFQKYKFELLVYSTNTIRFLVVLKRVLLYICQILFSICYLLHYLKLVSTIFCQIFIFHQIIALQKLLKMFFISSKKLFSFSRYSNFCIFVFPSFFPCQPLLWRLIQEKS